MVWISVKSRGVSYYSDILFSKTLSIHLLWRSLFLTSRSILVFILFHRVEIISLNLQSISIHDVSLANWESQSTQKYCRVPFLWNTDSVSRLFLILNKLHPHSHRSSLYSSVIFFISFPDPRYGVGAFADVMCVYHYYESDYDILNFRS